MPDSYISKVTDKDHAKVSLALASSQNTLSTTPYIPIDAVHQTATSAFVFVEVNGKATAKKVTLGTVFGSLVETTGLSGQERIILNRDVTEGTDVTISQK